MGTARYSQHTTGPALRDLKSCAKMLHYLPSLRRREIDYKHIRVRPGEYVAKLIVNGSEYSTKALVLKDQWFDKMY